jgi:hypothetical protein
MLTVAYAPTKRSTRSRPGHRRHGQFEGGVFRASRWLRISASVAIVSGCAAADSATPGCDASTPAWSDTLTVWASPLQRAQFNPSGAALLGDTLYAVGQSTGWGEPSRPTTGTNFSIIAHIGAGRSVANTAPPGGTSFQYPTVAASRGGGVTAVWAEHYASRADTAGSPRRARSLWAARFDGARWSDAEQNARG